MCPIFPTSGGLAVDWLHNKLYFSHEAGYHNYTIAVWDIQNGMERKHEVILESPAAIWDITCDPLAGSVNFVHFTE